MYSVTALFLHRNPGHNVKTTLIKTIVKVKANEEECVHASSVNMFKNRIDKYLVKAGYT